MSIQTQSAICGQIDSDTKIIFSGFYFTLVFYVYRCASNGVFAHKNNAWVLLCFKIDRMIVLSMRKCIHLSLNKFPSSSIESKSCHIWLISVNAQVMKEESFAFIFHNLDNLPNSLINAEIQFTFSLHFFNAEHDYFRVPKYWYIVTSQLWDETTFTSKRPTFNL